MTKKPATKKTAAKKAPARTASVDTATRAAKPATTTKKPEPPKAELPPGVTEKDTTCPHYKEENGLDYRAGDGGTLTFYNVEGFGWVVTTLGISKGRAGRAARAYGARLSDGKVVRVGHGQHVKSVVNVCLRKNRSAKLQEYVDLYNRGASDAGQIRDRISTRRAQGALCRSGAQGWF